MVRYTLKPSRSSASADRPLGRSQSAAFMRPCLRRWPPLKEIHMKKIALRTPTAALALSLLSAWASTAIAQVQHPHVPMPAAVQAAAQPVLHLSESAQTEVPQDWLAMTLEVQKEGLQAAAVQQQLNAVVAAALALGRPLLKPGHLEVRTGEMSVSPRHGREGKINAWSGSAQLIVQGRDAAQIASFAARLKDLVVVQMAWSLSPEGKTAAVARIQAEAIERFKGQAQTLTQQFGFAAYTLKELRVGAQDVGEDGAMPVMAARQAYKAADPVPTAAGQSRVVVSITGSILLR